MDELLEALKRTVELRGQVAVAKELRVSQATISRVISGKRGLGRKVLVAIYYLWPKYSEAAEKVLREM
jgi:predicted transcriptional regulator